MNNVTTQLLKWYEIHGRELPWRSTRDPYLIWLSEIILQQTRVAQGLPYYLRFTQAFPTLEAFAGSSEQQVLREWQGLGYYSRARNMLRCAREIRDKHQGNFPADYDQLGSLPGIGPYTAAAIASIAFKIPVAVVDGNVVRVLSRIFGIDVPAHSSRGRKMFQDQAQELLPHSQPDRFNQAIMDFGAMQCTPKPDCDTCPLNDTCYAFKAGLQASLPVKARKSKISHRHFYYLVWRSSDSILMKHRNQKDIWRGLYDFHLEESSEGMELESLLGRHHLAPWISSSGARIEEAVSYTHVLSHQKIQATFVIIDLRYENGLQSVARTFGLDTFTVDQAKALPKPILIDKFLKDQIF